MDLWDKAHNAVVDRLQNATGLFGKVHYETNPPERTDGGKTAVGSFETPSGVTFPKNLGKNCHEQKLLRN